MCHGKHSYSCAYINAVQLSRYGDLLRAERSGDQIPVEARFSARVQTGPCAHQTSCTMGTASFLRVKRQGRGLNYPPPSRTEGAERVELYLYSSSWPSCPLLVWNLPRSPKKSVGCARDGYSANWTDVTICSSVTCVPLLHHQNMLIKT